MLTEMKAQVETERYPVDVNYTLTVEAMVALGKYELANPDVARLFSVRPTYHPHQELRLFGFSRSIKADTATEQFEGRGFRMGTFEELLAFGASYPDIQRTRRIIALGSISHNGLIVGLSGSSDIRHLFLSEVDGWWPPGTYFLGVQSS